MHHDQCGYYTLLYLDEEVQLFTIELTFYLLNLSGHSKREEKLVHLKQTCTKQETINLMITVSHYHALPSKHCVYQSNFVQDVDRLAFREVTKER